ncbi:MAG: hypothetical protein JNK87_17665 [Bryobacterales bacterium]|nr:hypothetical protein [Bryobacterales bacterium]
MSRGFLLVAVLALVGIGWFFFGSRKAPEGQAALVHVNAATLEAMRAEFNTASSQTRVLALFSPT